MKIKSQFHYEATMAILLSFVGGIFDIYGLYNLNIYAMLHTGNVIKLSTFLIDGNMEMFIATLTIVATFALGILVANLYEYKRKGGNKKELLMITILLLVVTALIPNDQDPGVLSPIKILAGAMFGLEGAFLVHSFVRFGEYTYSATTMTANINRLMTNIFDRIVTKEKKHNKVIAIYLSIFLFFSLGVTFGYIYMKFLPDFNNAFMDLYGYNLLLLLPLACLIHLLLLKEPDNKETLE